MLLCCAVCCQVLLPAPCCRLRAARLAPRALFGGNSEARRQKELEKEEAFRAQAEVLKRRRGNTWQKDVSARRSLVKKCARPAQCARPAHAFE